LLSIFVVKEVISKQWLVGTPLITAY